MGNSPDAGPTARRHTGHAVKGESNNDATPTVPPPPSGLGSNSNYYLYSGCNPIVDLTVTINVTEDIVCQSTSSNTPPCTPQGTTPDKGFGFQLNANSPSGETIG